MAEASLATYVRDHLAGAQIAIGLLNDLSAAASDEQLKVLAAELLIEVEQDRTALERFANGLDQSNGSVKDAAGWLAHKFSRLKLQVDQPLGAFEAVEVLCLGVSGKRELWDALKAIQQCDPRVATLDLRELSSRADRQLARLERIRLELAPRALCQSTS